MPTDPPAPHRIYPAGHPAAVLACALAPGALAGWTRPLAAEQAALLPAAVRDLPTVPRLRPGVGQGAIRAVGATLVLDVGSPDPAESDRLRALAAAAGAGFLTLDGSLAVLPDSVCALGRALGVADRAESLAQAAAALLAATAGALNGCRIHYGCGPDGLETPAEGALARELFAHLGAALPPAAGPGLLVPLTPADLVAFAPDWIVTLDPAAPAALRSSPALADLPALRQGHVAAAPALPFPWLDRPPGINRLAGLAWLRHLIAGDPAIARQEGEAWVRRLFGVA